MSICACFPYIIKYVTCELKTMKIIIALSLYLTGCGVPLANIDDQVKQFDDSFSALVFHLRNEMLQNQVSVSSLQDTLALIPSLIKLEHHQFMTQNRCKIMDEKEIGDIFLHLNDYWTYLEYSLLEHIIQRHSSLLSRDLQEEMTKYKKDIEGFKQRTTMEQLLDAGLGVVRKEPPHNFSRIVTKLKRNPSQCTLKDLDNFRRRMCVEFNLPTFIMLLESVENGSLYIKWHIPSSEAHHFKHVSASLEAEKIFPDLVYLKVDMSTYGKLCRLHRSFDQNK